LKSKRFENSVPGVDHSIRRDASFKTSGGDGVLVDGQAVSRIHRVNPIFTGRAALVMALDLNGRRLWFNLNRKKIITHSLWEKNRL
jgi:hypothetical protein